MLANLSRMNPIRPTIVFGERFSGGEKTLEEIHEGMIGTARV